MSGPERPLVMAKAAPSERPSAGGSSIPLQMGNGRLPEGGQGANNMVKMKSIFDSPNSQAANVKVMSGAPRAEARRNERPVVMARPSMGQETEAPPPAPPPPPPTPLPPTNVEEVLVREGGPRGMTNKEAADIAAALDVAIASSSQALAAGETCVGVDTSTLEAAKEVQAGMATFGATGDSDQRLDLSLAEVDLIEKVIECGASYERIQAASKGKAVAFIAGGLVIGAIVLLVT